MDVHKILTGKLDISLKPFFLFRDVVAPIVQLFALEVQYQQKSLAFEFQESQDAFVLVDKSRVQQILINLLKNALETTIPG